MKKTFKFGDLPYIGCGYEIGWDCEAVTYQHTTQPMRGRKFE